MTLGLAQQDHLFFICGHYEGNPMNGLTHLRIRSSLGDYVLTSGELALMVVIDGASY